VKKLGLNNHKEDSDLTEAVKQTLYEDYLQAYSESERMKLPLKDHGKNKVEFSLSSTVVVILSSNA
jgi:hypothetical protein